MTKKKIEQQYSVTQTCHITFTVMAVSPEEAAKKSIQKELNERDRCETEALMFVVNEDTDEAWDLEYGVRE